VTSFKGKLIAPITKRKEQEHCDETTAFLYCTKGDMYSLSVNKYLMYEAHRP
jgi:hypothetical protein